LPGPTRSRILFALLFGHVAIPNRQRHQRVLETVALIEKIVELENEADSSLRRAGKLVVFEGGNGPVNH
jgi:hypothetical protein